VKWFPPILPCVGRYFRGCMGASAWAPVGTSTRSSPLARAFEMELHRPSPGGSTNGEDAQHMTARSPGNIPPERRGLTEGQRLVNRAATARYPGELSFALVWAALAFGISVWIVISMFIPLILKAPFQYNVLLGTLGVVALLLATYVLHIGVGAFLWTQRYKRTKDIDHYGAWCERRGQSGVLQWHRVQHFVVITAYKESLDALRSVVYTLIAQNHREGSARFCRQQIALVLAMEEREGQAAKDKADEIQREFGRHFREVITCFHPADRPGEIAGKASNFRFACERIDSHVQSGRAKEVDGSVIPVSHCIVHVADGDSMYDPNHFPFVTHEFCTRDDRYDLVFQPCIFSACNFWQLTPWVRQFILMHGASEMLSARGPCEFQIPYSTYGMALQTLQHIGGEGGAGAAQDGDVIAEDHHLFIKGFFATGGRLRVHPIFLPCFNHPVAGNECLTRLCCIRRCFQGPQPGCDSKFTQAKRHMTAVVELGYFFSLWSRGGFCGRRYGFGPRRWRLISLMLKLIKIHAIPFAGLWLALGLVLMLALNAIHAACKELMAMNPLRPKPQVCNMDYNEITRLTGFAVFFYMSATAFVGTVVVIISFTRMLHATQDAIEGIADPNRSGMGDSFFEGHPRRERIPINRGAPWLGTAIQLVIEYAVTGPITSIYYGFIPASIAIVRVILVGHRMKYVSAAEAATYSQA